MPKPPLVSGKDAVRVFEQFGWVYARRESSHMILKKPGVYGALSIPDERQVALGTLRGLLKVARITVEEFVEALENL